MFFIATFYKFKNISTLPQVSALTKAEAEVKLEAVPAVQKWLEQWAENLKVQGLIILAEEGLNATVSASSQEELQQFTQKIDDLFAEPLFYKYSHSDKAPFRRFKVKVRSEIVTLGTPELSPEFENNHHLTPSEWNRVLKEEKDLLLIDTRNWYETKIGTFKGAINPEIDTFTEFPDFMEKNNFAKDKKVLIFCTGGIRCEKGILELQRQGYNNVYQLEGGILNYLQQYPEDQFEGECFVFDHRVAVDQHLQPTQKYGLCPHCGQPSTVDIQCSRCDHKTMICEDCLHLDWKKETCSKHCAYQYQLHPGRKGPRQIEGRNHNKF